MLKKMELLMNVRRVTDGCDITCTKNRFDFLCAQYSLFVGKILKLS